MKIENQNIYGGYQQFADLIINSNENKIDELDRKFVQLIHDNTASIEERKELIESLSNIKNEDTPENEIKKSGNILRKFLDAIPGEVGKQIVKELFEKGAEYYHHLI